MYNSLLSDDHASILRRELRDVLLNFWARFRITRTMTSRRCRVWTIKSTSFSLSTTILNRCWSFRNSTTYIILKLGLSELFCFKKIMGSISIFTSKTSVGIKMISNDKPISATITESIKTMRARILRLPVWWITKDHCSGVLVQKISEDMNLSDCNSPCKHITATKWPPHGLSRGWPTKFQSQH